jgi:hypothetical protein
MRVAYARSIHGGEVEGDRPRVLYIWPMDLLYLLRIAFLQNIELSLKITNVA